LNSAQVNSMVFDPAQAGEIYMAMEYEGMGKTNNDGESITLTNKGFVDRSISSVTRAGDKLVAVEPQLGESTGVFVSADHGDSWKQLPDVKGLLGVHLKAIAGMPGEERILLAAAPRQLYKSLDGGAIWKPLPMRLIVAETPVANKTKTAVRTAKGKLVARAAAKPVEKLKTILPSEFFGLYTIKSGTKNVVFAATDLGMLKSADAGERWTMVELPEALAVTGLFVSPNSDGRLFARAVNGLYASSDFGDHWAKYSFPLPASDINDIAMPVSHDAPLLVATRVGLYTTVDNGASWYANVGGMPASTVSSVLYAGGTKTAYAVEYGRLYQSDDAGTSWNLVPSALPTTRIRQLWMPDSTSNRLYGITTDLGILFRN
jgi:photosystem II stability/assembly factor-like uncharacterized protein